MQAFSTRSKTRPTAMLKLILLGAAFASFLLSVYLYFIADDKSAGIFVGIWVPSIQSLGALLLAGERSSR
ncbi:MAG: hypothetical protein ABIP21_07210 [Acidimicrobiia bacterium]